MAKERKITGNIKGIVSKYSDNSFEFRPFGKGEPVYEEKQEFKNGVTIAKTRGNTGKRVVRIQLEPTDVDLFDTCVKKLGEVLPEAPDRRPASNCCVRRPCYYSAPTSRWCTTARRVRSSCAWRSTSTPVTECRRDFSTYLIRLTYA